MSSLADRPHAEAEAARRCSQPYGTHWDGCPCSLLRLDDEIQALRAELEIVRDDRETYRRAWMREESERSAAQAQIAELRAALELISGWSNQTLEKKSGYEQLVGIALMGEHARTVLARTHTDAMAAEGDPEHE